MNVKLASTVQCRLIKCDDFSVPYLQPNIKMDDIAVLSHCIKIKIL